MHSKAKRSQPTWVRGAQEYVVTSRSGECSVDGIYILCRTSRPGKALRSNRTVGPLPAHLGTRKKSTPRVHQPAETQSKKKNAFSVSQGFLDCFLGTIGTVLFLKSARAQELTLSRSLQFYCLWEGWEDKRRRTEGWAPFGRKKGRARLTKRCGMTDSKLSQLFFFL